MNIRDIPDPVFMVLIGLVSGEELDAPGGELCLVTGGERLPVPTAVLDLLEEVSWVVVTGRGAVPTRNGRGALREWLRKRFPGRKVDVSRLRPARVRVTKGV